MPYFGMQLNITIIGYYIHKVSYRHPKPPAAFRSSRRPPTAFHFHRLCSHMNSASSSAPFSCASSATARLTISTTAI